MSIASEITRIDTNIKAAYTALDGKGATLPAAGSQNSANLADTIDTITTGGGGDGDAEFIELKNVVENLQSTGNTYAFSSPASAATNQLTNIAGVLLTDENKEIWYKKPSQYSTVNIILPDGASIDTSNPVTVNGSQYYKITFTNKRYFIINETNLANCFSCLWDGFLGNITETYNGQYVNNLFSGVVAKSYSAQTLSTIPTFAASNSNCSIKNLYFINITFSMSTLSSPLLAYSLFMKKYYGGVEEAKKLFTNIQFPVTISPSEISFYSNSTNGQAPLVLFDDFPFILDYTGLSGTSYNGISAGLLNPKFDNIFNLKIILPDANFSWNGSTGLMDSYAFIITKEALKFMHEHAPTVSGKTISFRKSVACSGYWATFKAAMEAKGWTVLFY